MKLQTGITIFDFNSQYNALLPIYNEIDYNTHIIKEFHSNPTHLKYEIKDIYDQYHTIPNLYLTYNNRKYLDPGEQYWKGKYHDLHEELYKTHSKI